MNPILIVTSVLFRLVGQPAIDFEGLKIDYSWFSIRVAHPRKDKWGKEEKEKNMPLLAVGFQQGVLT